ncbi:E3 ubiquitin-protein ligase ATL6-like [Humulus lupulus]|uniref:E3 ubiquitin-protein ligase ATL6-like n=1 Tax=Humulus lupulus TaxID=3486 RepID=UPI002B416D28|nr:E3 ubiquitin-protein ligase ATL6-like [Humulus lupulus]
MTYSIKILPFVSLLLPAELPYVGAQPPGNSQNDPSAIKQFNTSLSVFLGVFMSVFFFIGFFAAIYTVYCSNAQGAENSVRLGAATGRSSRRNARGLDAAVLETFPTLDYSAVIGLKIGKGALECAVCLCEFKDDETLRLIPKCDHVFHPECVDMWLESHTTCPVCRANLVPEPDESLHRLELLTEIDIESQNGAAVVEPAVEEGTIEEQLPTSVPVMEPEVSNLKETLNRNRPHESQSSRRRRFFGRSQSLLQPGDNTERFTLRLPTDVRKKIMHRQLERATSLLVLPRANSSRSGRGGRFG